VTWVDCSVGESVPQGGGREGGGGRKRRLRHVHGVLNAGTQPFRQFIVEFLR
jgi:hypothetical protein